MKLVCEVLRLGLTPYREAWDLQTQLAGEIASEKRSPVLLLLEHPHTFTFGKRGNTAHLLWDETELARRGVEVHWVDRGGDVTYHGPGQLVGYPLLPLRPIVWMAGEKRIPQADYVGYLRKLEEALILALARFGITGERVPGLTGVWVRQHTPSCRTDCPPESPGSLAKIAAIGVKVDARGISQHGFALNVNPDMAYWAGIVGCGLAHASSTSLANFCDPPPAMALVMDRVVEAFGAVFGMEMVENHAV